MSGDWTCPGPGSVREWEPRCRKGDRRRNRPEARIGCENPSGRQVEARSRPWYDVDSRRLASGIAQDGPPRFGTENLRLRSFLLRGFPSFGNS
jgi:hypothetical protein